MKRVISLTIIWLMVASAKGATVKWSRPMNIRNATDVINFLPLFKAWNVGLADDPIVVNGVAFQPNGINLFDMQAPYDGFAPQSLSPLLGENYRRLLDSANFMGNIFEITGLTPGKVYTIQIWSSDARTFIVSQKRQVVLYTDNGPSVTIRECADGKGGPGQYVIGTFTADTSVQTIHFYGISQGKRQKDAAVINAIAVFEGSVFKE